MHCTTLPRLTCRSHDSWRGYTLVLQVSKKAELQELVIRIFNLAEQYNFSIHPIWIPREQNERADFQSHLNEYNHYDFTLTPEMV